MTTKIESMAGGIRVTGEMTVYTASQIKQGLVAAIADGPANVRLDLSGVTEFDTAGMQLLLMIYRELHASGRNLELGPESAIVHDVLRLCGVLGRQMDAANTKGRR
jgi:anti-sigma B factor antagonist